MTIVSANGIVDLELRTLAIALNSFDKWSTELAMAPMTSQQWKNDGLQSRTVCVCDVKHMDIYEDNVTCRLSAEGPRCLKKPWHCTAKLRLLYDGGQAGMIKFHQTKTTDMVANLFTKPLLSPDHHRLIGR